MAAASRTAAAAVVLLLSVGMASAIFCPETAKFNGCKKTGCLEIPSESKGGRGSVVCDACGEGYILAFGGTKHATCECAAGWAGKGNNGICMQCPAGTHIATGGPIASSTCLSCPEGSVFSEEAKDCLCPAGTFFHEESQPSGFKDMACKPCGRTQFQDAHMHTLKECKLCPAELLSTVDHVACVPASHPAALTRERQRAQALSRRSKAGAAEGDSSEDKAKPNFTQMLASLLSKWGSASKAPAAAGAAEGSKDVATTAPEAPNPAAKTPEPAAAAPVKVAEPAAAAPKVEAPKVVEAPKAENKPAEAPKAASAAAPKTKA